MYCSNNRITNLQLVDIGHSIDPNKTKIRLDSIVCVIVFRNYKCKIQSVAILFPLHAAKTGRNPMKTEIKISCTLNYHRSSSSSSSGRNRGPVASLLKSEDFTVNLCKIFPIAHRRPGATRSGIEVHLSRATIAYRLGRAPSR